MPLFFFDVKENDHLAVDHQGHHLQDRHHAHREAIRTIAEMAGEEIPKDGKLDLTVAVSDASHKVLFKTHVKFEPGSTEGE